MTKKTRKDILQAAFDLIEKDGWHALSLMELAKSCDMSFAELLEWFSDKTDLLVAYGRQLDLQTCADVSSDGEDDSPLKDRLFDVIMTRLDFVNENRGAVIRILKDIKCNPLSAYIVLPHLSHSMKLMLEAAGGRSGGIKGSVAVYTLSFCYLNTLRTWFSDDSVDLSKTMAALDKNLGYFENISGS